MSVSIIYLLQIKANGTDRQTRVLLLHSKRASSSKSSVSINEISHHKLPAGIAMCCEPPDAEWGAVLVVVNNACALTESEKNKTKQSEANRGQL